jgi:hypothetical protein
LGVEGLGGMLTAPMLRPGTTEAIGVALWPFGCPPRIRWEKPIVLGVDTTSCLRLIHANKIRTSTDE